MTEMYAKWPWANHVSPIDYDGDTHTFRESRKVKVFVNIMTIFAVGLLGGKISVGVLYFGQCEVQPMIPYYLIVPVNMFCSMALLCCLYWNTSWSWNEGIITAITFVVLLSLGWLIAGSVWVFPHWQSIGLEGCDTDEHVNVTESLQTTIIPAGPCCHLLTYRFAFGVTVVDWISLVIGPCVLYCL